MKTFVLYITIMFASFAQAQLVPHYIDLNTNDLVYDSVTDRIYASIPSSNGSNGNSIGVINPHTYELENTVFMGSEPSVLAISNDGQYIYSGFSGASIVRRFNVTTQMAEAQFALGSDSFHGPYYAEDIEVHPENNFTIAVARYYTTVSPRFAAVAIYDNGVVRPTVSTMYSGGEISNKIEFKKSDIVLGYNNETTGFNFSHLFINASGISLQSTVGSTPSGFGLDFIYNNNFAYFTNGSVVDATTTPFISGAFADVSGPVAYDTENDYVCFGSYNWMTEDIIFKIFDAETFLLVDEYPVLEASGEVNAMITCGEGCYALNTSDNHVVIFREDQLGINSVTERVSISMYPNPSSDFVNIETSSETLLKNAVLYDINGRTVADVQLIENKIDVRNIAQGLYLVKLTDENNNIYTEKIIKR